MAHIKIDFDGLNQQASTIGSITQSYESLNGRMKSLTEQISSGWEGEASKSYVEMMQKYIDQSGKMVNILETFKNYAVSATNDFAEVDQACASLIRNAF